MADDPVDAARDQLMLLTDLQRRRPVQPQVRMGTPEDKERAFGQYDPQPARPQGQAVIRKIQPVCDGIENGHDEPAEQQEEKDGDFLAGDMPLAHLLLSALPIERRADDHLNNESDKKYGSEDVHVVP